MNQMQAQVQQMHEMQRQMQAQAEQMHAQMHSHGGARAQMQDMHRNMMQASSQFSQMRPQAPGGFHDNRRGMTSSSFSSSSSFGGGRGAVSTSIVDGAVFVNGERVAQVPPGGCVSLRTVNGTVFLNNEVVWPRDGAAAPAPSTPRRGASRGASARAQRPRSARRPVALAQPARAPGPCPEQLARQSSAVGVCSVQQAEPCAVCLEDVQPGQMTRTLPCFHIFHRHCAEAHFQTEAAAAANSAAAGGAAAVVLCPVCRHPVSEHAVPDGADFVHIVD